MQTNAQAPATKQPQAAAPTAQKVEQPPKPVPPPEFQSEKIDSMEEPELIKILNEKRSTTFEKAKAAQRLARIGTKDAAPALSKLLSDAKLSTYARNALQAIADPAADEVLRNALSKLKGELLIGVINSIGYRKDPQAVGALSHLLRDSDTAVAQAAAAALGHISGPQAASAIREALGQTKGMVRSAVADAGLLCAEGLLAQGERDQALSLYNTLTAQDIPKPARLAAMHGIIAAETSLNRPRS